MSGSSSQIHLVQALEDTTEEAIKTEGFTEYLPKFTKTGSKKMTYLDTDQNNKKENKWNWIGVKQPDKDIKREIIAKAMEIFIEAIMTNHVYQFEGELFHQTDGGPIGLLITGTLARVVMLMWDQMYLKKLEYLKIQPRMYVRYVDDEGIAADPIKKGMKYEGGELVEDVETDEDRLGTEEDDITRTARIYREIADSVETMIQFEEDTVNNHDNKRIPVLDLECWVDCEGMVRHGHYRKPMASRQVVANSSAISIKNKRNILEEECIRRLRNYDMETEWNVRAKEMENMNIDMEEGGYPEGFRATTISKAVSRFEAEAKNQRLWEETEGREGRQIYRSGEERRRQKEESKQKAGKDSWFRGKEKFTATIRVPSSLNSALAKKIKTKMDNTEGPKGTKPKVIERGGVKILNSLHKANHEQRLHCKRKECIICEHDPEGGSSGKCYSSNIGYFGQCNLCLKKEEKLDEIKNDIEDRRKQGDVITENEEEVVKKEATRGIYHGESSRTLYGRTREHFGDYVKDCRKKMTNRTEDHFMMKHMREDHKEEMDERAGKGEESFKRDDFSFGLTGTFQKATLRILDEAARGFLEESGSIVTGLGSGRFKNLATKNEFHMPKDVRIQFVQL